MFSIYCNSVFFNCDVNVQLSANILVTIYV